MILKKLFNHESKTIESGALVVAITGVIGGMLGVLRNALLASHFGASPELDAYFAAFRIPDFLYGVLIFGIISAGFMPVFTRSMLSGKEKSWSLLSGTINLFVLVLGIFGVLAAIFARPLAGLIAPGFRIELADTVATLLRIMMIQPILLAVSNVISASLQSFKRFFIVALSSAVYNLGPIIGVLWFSSYWGVRGVVWGVVFGAFLNFAVQLPTLYGLGFRWSREIFAVWPEIKTITLLTIPRTINLLVSQITLFALTAIASILPAGTLSVYNFANDLAGFPLTLFGLSFATVAFPIMSQAWARKDTEAYRRIFLRTFTAILAWNLVAMFLMIAFREPLVKLTLMYGVFGSAASRATINTLAIALLALPAQSVYLLLLRAFFAVSDTRTPLAAAFVGSIVAIPASYTAGKAFGPAGLAFGPALAGYIQSAILYFMLSKKLGRLDGVNFGEMLMRVVILGAVSAGVAEISWRLTGFWLAGDEFRTTMARLIIAAVPTLITFILAAIALRIRDIIRIGETHTENDETNT